VNLEDVFAWVEGRFRRNLSPESESARFVAGRKRRSADCRRLTRTALPFSTCAAGSEEVFVMRFQLTTAFTISGWHVYSQSGRLFIFHQSKGCVIFVFSPTVNKIILVFSSFVAPHQNNPKTI